MKLTYSIKVVENNRIELTSFVSGYQLETTYKHGTFDGTIAELIESIEARKHELCDKL